MQASLGQMMSISAFETYISKIKIFEKQRNCSRMNNKSNITKKKLFEYPDGNQVDGLSPVSSWCVWIISTFTLKADVVFREVRQKWCRMVVSKWPGKIYVPRSTVTCTIKNVQKWWKVTKNENFYFRSKGLLLSSYWTFNAFWSVFRSQKRQNISFRFLAIAPLQRIWRNCASLFHFFPPRTSTERFSNDFGNRFDQKEKRPISRRRFLRKKTETRKLDIFSKIKFGKHPEKKVD